jgi:hypothetical protein
MSLTIAADGATPRRKNAIAMVVRRPILAEPQTITESASNLRNADFACRFRASAFVVQVE